MCVDAAPSSLAAQMILQAKACPLEGMGEMHHGITYSKLPSQDSATALLHSPYITSWCISTLFNQGINTLNGGSRCPLNINNRCYFNTTIVRS